MNLGVCHCGCLTAQSLFANLELLLECQSFARSQHPHHQREVFVVDFGAVQGHADSSERES